VQQLGKASEVAASGAAGKHPLYPGCSVSRGQAFITNIKERGRGRRKRRRRRKEGRREERKAGRKDGRMSHFISHFKVFPGHFLSSPRPFIREDQVQGEEEKHFEETASHIRRPGVGQDKILSVQEYLEQLYTRPWSLLA
jgi:hypothetical protein